MRNFFLTTLTLFSTLLFAQKPAALTVSLTSKDTVFFTIDDKSEKIIQHVVKPKQTLFSMAKFYGMSLEELYKYNPDFQTNPSLAIGQIVNVPLPNLSIERYKKKGFDAKTHVQLMYRVKQGETLFNLCKREFHMPVDSIVKRNKLTSNSLQIGQLLVMGWISTNGISAADRGGKPIAVESLKGQFEEKKKKIKPVSESGTAYFQKDSNEKGDLYVLHRSAKIGSTMLVKNAANGKTTYAKVIGRVPESYEKNTEIIVSPATAKAVKALDARFLVQITYFE
jgi:LysM repeat protein